jgi:hypothetical protein
MDIPAQQAAKNTRPLCLLLPQPLLSLNTHQGVFCIVLAMTRRDCGKPAFSLRKKPLRDDMDSSFAPVQHKMRLSL